MIRKLAISVLFLGLLLLSLSYRTGGMSPSDFIDASPNKPIHKWQVAHPETLLQHSQQALKADHTELAKALALDALSKNITNGLAFAQLVAIDSQDKHLGINSDKLAPLSEKLWPAHSGVQAKLANYWQAQNNLPKLVHAWHILMVRSPSFRKDIYPLLFELLKYQEGVKILKDYAISRPSWWLGFFSYTAQQNQALRQTKLLYALSDADDAVSPEERAIFIRTLIKYKLIEEAYFTWLAGLNEKQLQESSFIYNGSFEVIEKNTAFDWQFSKSPLFKAEISSTHGMVGQKALHVSLNNRDKINFRHISQMIKLGSGLYSFSLRARVDNFQTAEGLRWRIRCMNDQNTLLGESLALGKRAAWQELRFDFEVPTTDCSFQIVRLEASSPFVNNHFFKGSLWFDDFRVTRQTLKPQ